MEVPDKLKDFRNFLYIVWKELNLPDPTTIQYEIADYMQKGDRRAIIEGFRGVGKSWICSAFVVHQLLLDPRRNILVVSASKTRADDFSTFTLRLIHELPLLAHLRPSEKQRFSKISFDVGPAPASHAPSVKSLGVTSQLTGSRADIIVADDIEVVGNSATQGMRDKLGEQVKEFDAIIKPDTDSKILFLGTPQCEDTIYNKLTERGYKKRIWPAKYITEKVNETGYDGCVSELCVDESRVGDTTEPLRFSDIDLAEREASYGRTGFAMQFMLDTRLSDIERFPLKTSDLIVMSVDPEVAPEKLVWARDPKLEWDSSVPNVALSGDRFYRPMEVLGDYIPYTGSVMAIDPSGRGKDETGYAIVKMLNGYLYVVDAGGLQGGYSDEVLKALSIKAKQQKVNFIVVESNFGDGMFVELFKPILTKIHPCTIEEVRHNIQKEKRIIDTLEPVMNQHRLVVDPKVIQHDYESAQTYPLESQLKYQLIYQMSRLTNQRGAITQDDRLDALSMAVAYWTEQMAQDADKRMNERKVDLLDEELRRFEESYTGKSSLQTTWM
ncbi:MAG: DNA maturase B [Rhodopirellula sp.]|nr:DNA maturase B [Rhodopirellula sp.]